jgi:hypothetical protein
MDHHAVPEPHVASWDNSIVGYNLVWIILNWPAACREVLRMQLQERML